MLVTTTVEKTPEVSRSLYQDSNWPLIVNADGVTMLFTVAHARHLADALSRAVRDIENEKGRSMSSSLLGR